MMLTPLNESYRVGVSPPIALSELPDLVLKVSGNLEINQ